MPLFLNVTVFGWSVSVHFTVHRARPHDWPLRFGCVAHWKGLWKDPRARAFANNHLSSGVLHMCLSSEVFPTLMCDQLYLCRVAHTQVLPEI